MPLLILGVIVISGIVTYWYIANQNSDEPLRPGDIRGKFSNAAQDKANDIKRGVSKEIRKRAGIYDVDYSVEDDGYGRRPGSDDPEDNTIPFPDDVERAKRKRDIH